MRQHSRAVARASEPTDTPLTARRLVASALVVVGLLALASPNPLLVALGLVTGLGATRQ